MEIDVGITLICSSGIEVQVEGSNETRKRREVQDREDRNCQNHRCAHRVLPERRVLGKRDVVKLLIPNSRMPAFRGFVGADLKHGDAGWHCGALRAAVCRAESCAKFFRTEAAHGK